MNDNILFGSDARNKLASGISLLSKVVGSTLGARGRNVAIDKSLLSPRVMNDGVSIAKEVESNDPFENIGIKIVREASIKTNDMAGDGTTTSTVLAQAIIEEGLKVVESGISPVILKNDIDKALKEVLEQLETRSIKITTLEEKERVATISSKDKTIGKIVASAVDTAGVNGVISVEEYSGTEIETEYKEGMQFPGGYLSPYFVTDQDKMVAEIKNPFILVTDQEIDTLQDLIPMFEEMVKVSKDILIIAPGLNNETLPNMVLNKIKGILNILAVKTPYTGRMRKDTLQDICDVTGATLITGDINRNIRSITLDDLGRCEKVISTKDGTTIIGGRGNADDIEKRIKEIKALIAKTTVEFDKESLSLRLSKLSGGVVSIKIGAMTETEMKDKKLRVEDAVNATKAAVEEGIVAGGGITLLDIANRLEDAGVGFSVLKRALQRPAMLILENAGLNPDEILPNTNGITGYDVLAMEYVDMVDKGIIDPVKVTRSALQNAVSVAGMVLTTDCLIVRSDGEKVEGKVF